MLLKDAVPEDLDPEEGSACKEKREICALNPYLQKAVRSIPFAVERDNVAVAAPLPHRRCMSVKGVFPLKAVRISLAGFLFILLLFSASSAPAEVRHVTPSGAGNHSGLSWSNAYGEADFKDALDNDPAVTEFWVAAGIYRPSPGNRDESFNMRPGVSLYGGFAGTETDRSQRDWAKHVTVLTGDLAKDDVVDGSGLTTTIKGDNSYTVVTAVNAGVDAVLDGFVITGGDASLASGTLLQSSGGGMVNDASSVTVNNCSFVTNRAAKYGGGMGNRNSSPVVANTVFEGNDAGEYGGGMFNMNSGPFLLNCTFSGNSSGGSGAGLYNYDGSSPVISRCTFSGNTAAENGGAVANVDGCNALVGNCTFSGNTAQTLRGGGMFNSDGWGGSPSSPSVMNCTFSGNGAPATKEGGSMYNFGASSPVVTNSIFWGADGVEIGDDPAAAPVFSFCVIQGGYAGGSHILDEDPMLGPLADNGGPTLTHALPDGSSAIDSGTSVGAPAVDQRNVPRPQGGGVDIGAFEYEPVPQPSGGGGCSAAPVPLGGLLLLLPLAVLFSRK